MCVCGYHMLFDQALAMDDMIRIAGSLLPASVRVGAWFMPDNGSRGCSGWIVHFLFSYVILGGKLGWVRPTLAG